MSDNQPRIERVEEMARRAAVEFGDVGDYIWKSTRLISDETQRERAKLEAYFPDDPDRQMRRWAQEGFLLASVFPLVIAQGNFFSIMSLFEVRLRLLLKELEPRSRPFGFRDVLEALDRYGGPHSSQANWKQVDAAIEFRNCFMHHGGILDGAKHVDKIRQLVERLEYWPVQLRNHASSHDVRHVLIVEHPTLGDRLAITNSYPYWLAGLFRDYFACLCARAVDSLRSR
jgi:hypothetical protein